MNRNVIILNNGQMVYICKFSSFSPTMYACPTWWPNKATASIFLYMHSVYDLRCFVCVWLLFSHLIFLREEIWRRQMSLDRPFSKTPFDSLNSLLRSIETFSTPDVLYNECLIYVMSPLTVIPAYVRHALKASSSQVLLFDVTEKQLINFTCILIWDSV